MNSANVTATRSTEKVLGAFLGAAVGDALGWPNEMPTRRVRAGDGERVRSASFETWHRRSGGRFMPHEETIRAGEFSDDTQLLLCSARSLLQGTKWLDHFVFKELPTWRLYQRGGGGATKRAVGMWLNGCAPWSLSPDDPKLKAYFDAGGNGVAMRILPHAVAGIHDDTFYPTAQGILLNGVCTHGHPRALIGALAYGFVVWRALRLSGTLAYGELLEQALNSRKDWSFLPEHSELLSSWLERAQKVFQEPFDRLWSKTQSEMLTLLQKSLAGIKAGAISIDSKVLTDLGCFDRFMSGSGTICAAAAIYIASKYAPDPQNGIAEAASSRGADTDTLASMSGGLLGVITGTEWLQRYLNQLQDERYITELARRLESLDYDQASRSAIGKPFSKPAVTVDNFLDRIRGELVGDTLELPDGRKVTITEVTPVDTRSQNLKGKQWKLRTEDGQTLYVKKLERSTAADTEQPGVPGRTKSVRVKSKAKAVKLIVRNLEKARRFYHEILGLKVVRQSKTLVNLGGIISLVSREHLSELEPFDKGTFQTRSILCIECSDIEVCYDRAKSSTEAKVGPIQDRLGRRAFSCLDPDENVIEVFESSQERTTEPSSRL